MNIEPPVAHLENGRFVANPRIVRPARTVRQPHANSRKPLPTENTQLDGSKQSDPRTCEEHEEQPATSHLADSPQGDRIRSVEHADNKPSPTA
jgi:hypothetical protein